MRLIAVSAAYRRGRYLEIMSRNINILALVVLGVVLVILAPRLRRAIPAIGQSIRNTNPANPDNLNSSNGETGAVSMSANDTGASSTPITFTCLDGQEFTVQYTNQSVQLTLPNNQSFILNATPADSNTTADGNVVYSDGRYEFYTQSQQGFVEENDVWVFAACDPQSELPNPSPSPSPSPTPNPTPNPSPTASPPPLISGATLFTCQNGLQFQVVFLSNQAELYLESQPVYLSSVPAASGARYSDGRIILYTQGNQAAIDMDGFRTYDNCIQQSGGNGGTVRPTPPNALW